MGLRRGGRELGGVGEKIIVEMHARVSTLAQKRVNVMITALTVSLTL